MCVCTHLLPFGPGTQEESKRSLSTAKGEWCAAHGFRFPSASSTPPSQVRHSPLLLCGNEGTKSRSKLPCGRAEVLILTQVPSILRRSWRRCTQWQEPLLGQELRSVRGHSRWPKLHSMCVVWGTISSVFSPLLSISSKT